jgi:alkylmercury lyase
MRPGRAVAQHLLEIFPRLDEADRRLSLALYRALARGAPVALHPLASGLDMPLEAIERRLQSWPGVYYDDERRVIGYWGLTIRPMRHQMRIDGHTLFAWCAWDTLFLPALLGTCADVVSACQASGALVRLSVSPEAVKSADPAELQVSFVLPQTEDVRADVITSFCHFVHFFRSPRDAEPWLAAHPGTQLQPLEDAFEIGRIRNRVRYGIALQALPL